MIDLNQGTAELAALLDGQKDWTKELRAQVVELLWKYASDRLIRNLAELIGHPEVAPKRIVQRARELQPLVGLVPIDDFLQAWYKAAEQEQSDLKYIAWLNEQERQR